VKSIAFWQTRSLWLILGVVILTWKGIDLESLTLSIATLGDELDRILVTLGALWAWKERLNPQFRVGLKTEK
jgi:hypothetical protein